MDFYTIHVKVNQSSNEPIAIKEGFNWYSLFFNLLWSIYNKIWMLATFFLLLPAIVIILQPVFNIFTLNILALLLSVLIAFHANDFYRKSIHSKGYKFVDVVFAKSSSHAIYAFLRKTNPKHTVC